MNAKTDKYEYLSYKRSESFPDAVADSFSFRQGSGLTKTLGESNYYNYVYIHDCIATGESTDPRGHNYRMEYMDEIIENKWFMHVYDIHNMVN